MRRLLLLLLLSLPLFAQGVRLDPLPSTTISTNVGPGGYPQILAIPGAAVKLCNYPANGFPCSDLATTYGDATLGSICPTNAQVVYAAGNSCVGVSDDQGNFGFWVAPGNYVYELTVNGTTYGPYPITAFSTSSNVSGALCVENYGTGSDYGQVINAAVAAQPLLTPSYLVSCNQGDHQVSTPIVIRGPVSLSLNGSNLIPQPGGADGAWGSAPIILSGATVTAGSTAVTVTSTAGLLAGMAIGGTGIPSGNYIGAASDTTVTLLLPASLNFVAVAATGSTTLTAVSRMNGLAVGQTLTNAAIPGGTTISSINYSNQSLVMSAAATAGPAEPISVSVGGSWTTNLTAQRVAPVIQFQYNVNALRDAEGQNVGAALYGVTIQDPGLTKTCTLTSGSTTMICLDSSGIVANDSVTGAGVPSGTTTSGPPSGTAVTLTNAATSSGSVSLQIGYNLGRTVSGVQGLQVAGFDKLKIYNFDAENLTGSGIILGGYNASPNNHNGLVRESNFYSVWARDSGDWATGQPSLCICTGSASGDEINQIGFENFQAVFNNGEGLTETTYNSSHTGVNGPRLIFFHGNTQLEGGSHITWNLNSPVDMIGLQRAGDVTFDQLEINGPGYGYSMGRIDNAVTFAANGSRLRSGAASSVSCTVNVTNGSTAVTLVSGCNGSFDTSGRWDGSGWRATDGGACSTVCNVYLAPLGAVTSTTAMTLAAVYPGATGTATFLYTPGGYFFSITQPNTTTSGIALLHTRGITANGASGNALAALGVVELQTYFVGYVPKNVGTLDADLTQSGVPMTLWMNYSNFVNPRDTSGPLANFSGENITQGMNGSISFGQRASGNYNQAFIAWINRGGLGSNTNAMYGGMSGGAQHFTMDDFAFGYGPFTTSTSQPWFVDPSGNETLIGNEVIGGILNTDLISTVSAGSLDVTTTRTTMGAGLRLLCPSIPIGGNCSFQIVYDSGSLDSTFCSLVIAGVSNAANRTYCGLNGGTSFASFRGGTWGYGTTTDPTTDLFQIDGATGNVTLNIIKPDSSTSPSGACSPNGALENTSASGGQLWLCISATWTQVTIP